MKKNIVSICCKLFIIITIFLFSTVLHAQQCSSGISVSNVEYYFDGDDQPGTTGWGARNLTVNPSGLTGSTGTVGRIIVNSTWGWNNGNQ